MMLACSSASPSSSAGSSASAAPTRRSTPRSLSSASATRATGATFELVTEWTGACAQARAHVPRAAHLPGQRGAARRRHRGQPVAVVGVAQAVAQQVPRAADAGQRSARRQARTDGRHSMRAPPAAPPAPPAPPRRLRPRYLCPLAPTHAEPVSAPRAAQRRRARSCRWWSPPACPRAASSRLRCRRRSRSWCTPCPSPASRRSARVPRFTVKGMAMWHVTRLGSSRTPSVARSRTSRVLCGVELPRKHESSVNGEASIEKRIVPTLDQVHLSRQPSRLTPARYCASRAKVRRRCCTRQARRRHSPLEQRTRDAALAAARRPARHARRLGRARPHRRTPRRRRRPCPARRRRGGGGARALRGGGRRGGVNGRCPIATARAAAMPRERITRGSTAEQRNGQPTRDRAARRRRRRGRPSRCGGARQGPCPSSRRPRPSQLPAAVQVAVDHQHRANVGEVRAVVGAEKSVRSRPCAAFPVVARTRGRAPPA